MTNKFIFEVREFYVKDKKLTDKELDLFIKEMWEQGFRYEGINPNNGAYSFIKSNRKVSA
jgi:hypothetical protein